MFQKMIFPVVHPRIIVSSRALTFFINVRLVGFPPDIKGELNFFVPSYVSCDYSHTFAGSFLGTVIIILF